MTRSVRAAMAMGGLVVLLVGLAAPALAADKWVTMYANSYRPGVVTIDVGDRVTWVNDDDVPHDAVGNGWSTALLTYGDSDSVRFTRAGRYAYHCSIHPEMRSAVVVRATSGSGSGAGTVPPTDTAIPPARGPGDGGPLTALVLLGLATVLGTAAVIAAAAAGRRPGPGADRPSLQR